MNLIIRFTVKSILILVVLITMSICKSVGFPTIIVALIGLSFLRYIYNYSEQENDETAISS